MLGSGMLGLPIDEVGFACLSRNFTQMFGFKCADCFPAEPHDALVIQSSCLFTSHMYPFLSRRRQQRAGIC